MLGPGFLIVVVSLGYQANKSDYPPPGSYPHTCEISEEYEKFHNITTLNVRLGVVWSNGQNKLEIQVYQSFEGEGRTKPLGSPRLMMVNHGEDGWRYLDYHPVVFLVDGERLKFDPKRDSTVRSGYVLEYLWPDLSKYQFLKVIYGSRVQVQVGLDEFELGESRLNALKDFASYIQSPSRRLSSLEMTRTLQEARNSESLGLDDDARKSYENIIHVAEGSYEAAEALKGIKRLDDPARREAYRKRMEAEEKAKAKAESDVAKLIQEKALRYKIETKLTLGRALEARNARAALSYYKEILKLANGLEPEPPEVAIARSKIKALSPAK
jgi:hypothetical protein